MPRRGVMPQRWNARRIASKDQLRIFGAGAAVKAALELEQLGRRRDLAEVTKAIDTLDLALAALRPELEAL